MFFLLCLLKFTACICIFYMISDQYVRNKYWNCSDSVVFWNCSDSVVFWNCSDSVVFFAFHFMSAISWLPDILDKEITDIYDELIVGIQAVGMYLEQLTPKNNRNKQNRYPLSYIYMTAHLSGLVHELQ
jgi:hypothetical protein